MKMRLFAGLCCCSLFLACLHEFPTVVASKNESGRIIVDTLSIDIIYDATPGLSYPMMRHEINFVDQLNVSGFIDSFDGIL